MKQMGRNLLDCYDGFLLDVQYLILDRDTIFQPFSDFLKDSDTDVVLLPPKSPNLNAYIERYMRAMKSECLNKFIFFAEKSLRRAVNEFTEHYHSERNHQGIGNEIITPGDEVGRKCGEIQCNERLGGMLKYYYRDAA
ncbi:MAG TPA: hypothetical protein EYN96_10845 [Candidatus Hydrogenedentes bacterium]|nr:hypothetical protein [Candidatus Hydrogenedentota bacterium]